MEERVNIVNHPSSYRDPSGFVFTYNNEIYRAVQDGYRPHYDLLRSSGLYDELVENDLLIPHEEVPLPPGTPKEVKLVLKPKRIVFPSYPYEWSFNAFKDAALLTLDIAKRSLNRGLVLKDGSAFNVMFEGVRPIFIDSLSFEKYREGESWNGYRQFCEQFLAPLALASTRDVRNIELMRTFFNGIPLDLTVKMLPRTTLLRLGTLLHLHLHAWSQGRYTKIGERVEKKQLPKLGLMRLYESLSDTVSSFKWKAPRDVWTSYYDKTNYTDRAFVAKRKLVERFVNETNPNLVWDLGANTGEFSKPVLDCGAFVVAMDSNHGVVDLLYQEAKKNNYIKLLPLVMDLLNPSPALGWINKERDTLLERGPVDGVLALALVHHLAISGNIPLSNIASFLAAAGRYVLVEFIPKDDSRVKHLLSTRVDIFKDYNQGGFETAVRPYFKTIWREGLPESGRIVYALEKR